MCPVSTSYINPFQRTASWLSSQAGFPRFTLPEKALLLLWVSAAQEAEGEAENEGATKMFERRVGSQTSALKAHALRRSQVHFKCDNSAKV